MIVVVVVAAVVAVLVAVVALVVVVVVLVAAAFVVEAALGVVVANVASLGQRARACRLRAAGRTLQRECFRQPWPRRSCACKIRHPAGLPIVADAPASTSGL